MNKFKTFLEYLLAELIAFAMAGVVVWVIVLGILNIWGSHDPDAGMWIIYIKAVTPWVLLVFGILCACSDAITRTDLECEGKEEEES